MARSMPAIATCLFACLALVQARPTAAQLNDLVRRVPDRPNTVIVLDVEKVYSSPMSEKEQWRGKMLKAFESGMIMVPPKAT